MYQKVSLENVCVPKSLTHSRLEPLDTSSRSRNSVVTIGRMTYKDELTGTCGGCTGFDMSRRVRRTKSRGLEEEKDTRTGVIYRDDVGVSSSFGLIVEIKEVEKMYGLPSGSG